MRRKTAASRAGLASALIVALLLAGLALPAAPAHAHARYERSEPADGAVLDQSPPRVDAWFSQEMRRSGGLPTMVVASESGDVIADDAVLDNADRTHMYVELPPALPDGRYTVIWHNLSDEDGDEAQGAFHFFVGEPATEGSPTTTAAPSPPATAGPEPTATSPPERPLPTAVPAPLGEGGDGGDGVPVWALIAGIIGGAAAGAGGGLALGARTRR